MSNSRKSLMTFFVMVLTSLVLVPSAFGWTHLGGDPLMSSIKGSGQTARNDFVKKSRSAKFKTAMRRAGLNAKQRKAVAKAIVRGKFVKCELSYGDTFVRMAYGAGTVFVDRNVTFLDPNYRSHSAPAFCLTVRVAQVSRLSDGSIKTVITTIKIKVPWKCVNFAIVSIKKRTTTHTPPPAPKPTPVQPQPTPQPPTTPPAPPTQPQDRAPSITCVYPAHLYIGGSYVIHCKTTDAENDPQSVSFITDEYTHVSGIHTSDFAWDNTSTHASPCPAGTVCWDATIWGDKVTPAGVKAQIIAIVLANDKEGYSYGETLVYPDDFGLKAKMAADAHNYSLEL
jgi:hypothetical protein